MDDLVTYLRYSVGWAIVIGVAWLIWRDSRERDEFERERADQVRRRSEDAKRIESEDRACVELAVSKVPNFHQAFELLLERFEGRDILDSCLLFFTEIELLNEIDRLDDGKRLTLPNLQSRHLKREEREVINEARDQAGEHWRQDFAWQGPDGYATSPTADTLRTLVGKGLVSVRGEPSLNARSFSCTLTALGKATLEVANRHRLCGSSREFAQVKRLIPNVARNEVCRLFSIAVDAELLSAPDTSQSRSE